MSVRDGRVQVGDGQAFLPSDGTLAVNGSATFNDTSSLGFFIDGPGTTPGTDYSQLTATGAVDLGNANLSIGQGVIGFGSCATLTPGDVDTLVTAGSLNGTFNGIPDGTKIPLSSCFGSPGTLPTVRINYTANSVTATVMTPATTTLAVSPSSPVTDQQVMLTATVTASQGTPPGGPSRLTTAGLRSRAVRISRSPSTSRPTRRVVRRRSRPPPRPRR